MFPFTDSGHGFIIILVICMLHKSTYRTSLGRGGGGWKRGSASHGLGCLSTGYRGSWKLLDMVGYGGEGWGKECGVYFSRKCLETRSHRDDAAEQCRLCSRSFLFVERNLNPVSNPHPRVGVETMAWRNMEKHDAELEMRQPQLSWCWRRSVGVAFNPDPFPCVRQKRGGLGECLMASDPRTQLGTSPSNLPRLHAGSNSESSISQQWTMVINRQTRGPCRTPGQCASWETPSSFDDGPETFPLCVANFTSTSSTSLHHVCVCRRRRGPPPSSLLTPRHAASLRRWTHPGVRDRHALLTFNHSGPPREPRTRQDAIEPGI